MNLLPINKASSGLITVYWNKTLHNSTKFLGDEHQWVCVKMASPRDLNDDGGFTGLKS